MGGKHAAGNAGGRRSRGKSGRPRHGSDGGDVVSNGTRAGTPSRRGRRPDPRVAPAPSSLQGALGSRVEARTRSAAPGGGPPVAGEDPGGAFSGRARRGGPGSRPRRRPSPRWPGPGQRRGGVEAAERAGVSPGAVMPSAPATGWRVVPAVIRCRTEAGCVLRSSGAAGEGRVRTVRTRGRSCRVAAARLPSFRAEHHVGLSMCPGS